MADSVLRFGVVGLGRGFQLMRPTFIADIRCRLAAAADPRPEARAAFEAEFQGRAYASAEELCADPTVDVVYIASPHQHHAEQAVMAARAGKHLLVEKPMALDLASCRAISRAAAEAGVSLVVGPSHSFDAPVALAAELAASGAYGAIRMVTALNFTDFLYRPRRPEELQTTQGGGVVFNQAAHQVDVVRRLIGAEVASVRATTSVWDPARPTEGAYQAFLRFETGASASLVYSGYGRFDTDALMDWVGETGFPKDSQAYAVARRRLSGAPEPELKAQRAYGGPASADGPPPFHEHFGFVLASCERADLRLTPAGVEVYGDLERRAFELPAPLAPRMGVIDEIWAAVVEGIPPLHSGAWGEANLAVCLAMLKSAAEGREVPPIVELETAP